MSIVNKKKISIKGFQISYNKETDKIWLTVDYGWLINTIDLKNSILRSIGFKDLEYESGQYGITSSFFTKTTKFNVVINESLTKSLTKLYSIYPQTNKQVFFHINEDNKVNKTARFLR